MEAIQRWWVQRELGAPFLAYMLNVKVEQVNAGSPLGAAAEQVLADLGRTLSPADSEPRFLLPADRPRSGALDWAVLRYELDADTSAVNRVRQALGGEIPKVAEELDPATRLLAALTRDVYPALLLPPSHPSPFPSGWSLDLSGPLSRHPKQEQFQAAVLRDPLFADAFVPGHAPDDLGLTYFSSEGHGGTLQLVMLSTSLIAAAATTLRRDDALTPQALVDSAATRMADLRTLVARRSVRTTARLGLAGLHVPKGTRVATRVGVLRAPTEGEAADTRHVSHARVDAVLETDVKLEIKPYPDGLPNEVDGWTRDRLESLHRGLDDKVRTLALALLASVERAAPVTAIRSVTMIDHTLEPVGLSFGPTPMTLVGEELRPADHGPLVEWVERVASHKHSTIDVAVDRLLVSLPRRSEPADGLIDATIALESLFGTSAETRGEVTFRIATACAYLLAPDDGAVRRERRREVARIYDARSTIVHGSAPPDDVAQLRDRAVATVRAAIIELFTARTDLLQNRDRGIELILGPALST